MTSDIHGQWVFEEDFTFGTNKGIARITQSENSITGELIYTETIEGETPFTIKCTIEGTINGINICIKATDYEILEGDKNIEYVLGELNGTINSQGDIIGSTVDKDGICGVFTLKRKA